MTPFPKISDHAARWKCSPRTILRWKARGLDPADSLAVIDFLIASPAATLPQLLAASEQLAIESANIKAGTDRPFLTGFRLGVKPDPRP